MRRDPYFEEYKIQEIDDSEFGYDDGMHHTVSHPFINLAHLSKSEEYGFQEKLNESSELFDLTLYDIPRLNNLLRNDRIKRVSNSDNAWVVVTENNRVIRYRFDDDKDAVEYEIPELSGGGLLSKAFTLGDRKVANIDRVFQDPKGNIIFLSKKEGITFQFLF